MIWIIWFLVMMAFIASLIGIRVLEIARKNAKLIEKDSIIIQEIITQKQARTVINLLSWAIIIMLLEMIFVGIVALIIQNQVLGG